MKTDTKPLPPPAPPESPWLTRGERLKIIGVGLWIAVLLTVGTWWFLAGQESDEPLRKVPAKAGLRETVLYLFELVVCCFFVPLAWVMNAVCLYEGVVGRRGIASSWLLREMDHERLRKQAEDQILRLEKTGRDGFGDRLTHEELKHLRLAGMHLPQAVGWGILFGAMMLIAAAVLLLRG